MSNGPIANLLALERAYDDLPQGAEARILARVEDAVGGQGGGGDGGEDGGGPGTSHAPDAGAAGATSGLAGAGRLAPWLGRAGLLAVGAVAGASGHAVLSPRPAAAPTVVASAAAPASALVLPAPAPIGVRVEDLPSEPLPAAPSAASPVSREAVPPRRDDGRIVAERAELDVARAALSRGRLDACLEAVERHARTYGEGHFAEEREVLAVQALAAAGRKTEAAARARRFRERYPTSLFGPAMSESLAPPE